MGKIGGRRESVKQQQATGENTKKDARKIIIIKKSVGFGFNSVGAEWQ